MSRQENTGFSLRGVGMLLAGVMYWLFIRPQLLKLGTRLGESQRRLPGDDLIPEPNLQATRAIDIDAPPEAVWPWIAQMGRDRSGWYRFDLLDNNGIPSATYLRQEVPPPQAGMTTDNGLQIMRVEETRMLLVGVYDRPNWLGTATDMTTLYLLERRPDGSTRLLIRTRAYSYDIQGALFNLLYEPLDSLMTAKQLDEIKARAETMAYLRAARPYEVEISLN